MPDSDETDAQQGYLFPPFSRDGTSREAAGKMAGTPAAETRRRVLEFIVLCGKYGATDEEIVDALGLSPNTARPRRWELAGLDGRSTVPPLIGPSGGKRLTRSGRQAMVWVAIQFAEGLSGDTA